jgi:SAM-dependent methyltransferase
MLNWLARYAPAVAALEEAGPLGSVLDVGCGRHGLACVRPDQPFVGLEINFTGDPAPTMVAYEAEPGPLPFADASFDTVICLDALEHVPPDDRASFVAELARVTAGRLLLACPTDAAQPLDDLMRRHYAERGAPEPSWLGEHAECGLPAAAEIEALVGALDGFAARRVPMANGLLSTLTVVADMYPDFAAGAAAEIRERAAEWTELLASARFGPSFRDGWLIERTEALTAKVDAADLERSAAAALQAPGATRRVPAPALPPALDTQARRRLWLAPDWHRPETWLPALSAYLTHAPADGSACLCLDATATGSDPLSRGDSRGLTLVATLVSEACERLAGDAPFGDVLIVDAPADRSFTVDVDSAAAVRAALGAKAPEDLGDPEAARERLLFAKRLADDLRDIVDRHRLDAAPEPDWDDPEPLVTVRIPTWNGIPGLIGRAIPSVLGGTYRNVEVLVCSDGPDPAARGAVQAIGDPRVRYLELPERPVYPAHKLSFWQTTGLRPANHALDRARGAFIAPLDHDDAFTADHVERLLEAARRERADLAHGQALCEQPGGPPVVVGSAPLARGQVAHGAVLYSSRLAHLRYDPHCWVLEQPGDWNMWSRMAATGIRTAYVPSVVVAHSRERTSIEADPGVRLPAAPTADELIADVRATDAAWLLDVAPLHACLPTS